MGTETHAADSPVCWAQIKIEHKNTIILYIHEGQNKLITHIT